MKFAIVIALVAMLCACGTTSPSVRKDLERNAENWVGHTLDELVVANGEPFDIYPVASGGRVLEYFRLGTDNQTPIRKKRKDRTAQEKQKNTALDSTKPCKILFNISASDIVQSWLLEGEDCK